MRARCPQPSKQIGYHLRHISCRSARMNECIAVEDIHVTASEYPCLFDKATHEHSMRAKQVIHGNGIEGIQCIVYGNGILYLEQVLGDARTRLPSTTAVTCSRDSVLFSIASEE